MLYIGYLIIVNGHSIKKIGLEFCIFELPSVENRISRCPSPFRATSSPVQQPNRVKNK